MVVSRADCGPVPSTSPSPFDGASAGEERTIEGVRLVWAPAGSFTMGSPPGELERRPDEEQVPVTLTRGFRLHDALETATPSEHGDYSRVGRGGGWPDDGWACRSAFRLRFEPERRYDHIGFRVVAVRP